MELVFLLVFGRVARLVWYKRRWRCPSGDDARVSNATTNPSILLKTYRLSARQRQPPNPSTPTYASEPKPNLATGLPPTKHAKLHYS